MASSLPNRFGCAPYSVAAAERVGAELGLSPTTASILVRRGHDTPVRARRFLRGEERGDAVDLPGVEAAAASVLAHVERGSRIVVHGDYDVDGVCSTAVLLRVLRALGADPRWLLPSRTEDGYGLTAGTVARMAADGAALVIAVDCGVTSVAEVADARTRGIDVVVVDHHRPGVELPECPVVHPALGEYPYPDLCATAVAHKLGEVLRLRAGLDPAGGDDDLDLVGLATAADLVPLRGENRRLVREGLVALARTAKPGLKALMRISGADRSTLDEQALGFRLGPRLNAAGRIRRADAALELLITEDQQRAEQVADELDLLNRERQDTESRILFAAEAVRAERPDAPVHVVAGEGWHVGVVGIVASRLVERYHRPCVVVAMEGDTGRGSGRSISAYDLHAGLSACAEHLERFGGHRMAAGLEVRADRLADFTAALHAHAAASLAPEDLTPTQRVDALVPGGALGLALAEDLARLGPFGPGNPRPTLLVPGARLGALASMGKDGGHARLSVSSGGARARAVAFGITPGALTAEVGEDPCHVAVTLEAREWNGAIEPRLVVRAVCPPETGECRVIGEPDDLWPEVERAMAAPTAPAFAPARGPATRSVSDRRGQGIAGVAGDLLSSGESVLVVCADAERRRAGLERALGGLCHPAGSGPLVAVSWSVLGRQPALAGAFAHLVAVDPPASAAAEAWLSHAPAPPDGGSAHLAWGPAEADFALAAASAALDPALALRELYRELRAVGGASGEALARLLRGGGGHPRPAAEGGTLLRILVELELVAFETTPEGPGCTIGAAAPTRLERSATYAALGADLAEAERYLVAQGARSEREPAAATG